MGLISQLSALEIGRRIAGGTLDPVAVTEHFLAAIEACPDRSIFIEVTAKRALNEAWASRRRYEGRAPLGPLDGVPVAWKDLIDIQDLVTTAGSAFYWDNPPSERDAPIVRHLSAAGMICLGKTNLSEFAFSGLGINRHFGTPVNPNGSGTARIPGGSSSGSAVAVARGLAPLSVATDTSGSVRIPAALCGLVGHLTSPGRIDRRGVSLLSMSLDTVGSITRCVEDCILLDQALRGQPIKSVEQEPLTAARAVVPENFVLDEADEPVAACFEAALERLRQAGLPVERTKLEELDRFAETTAHHGTLVAAEAHYVHRSDLEDPNHHLIDENIRARLASATGMSAYDLLVIQQTRKALRESMRRRLGTDGLLLMPCTPNTAPPIAELLDDPNCYARANLRILRNTMIGNYFGLCGLTVPCGRDGNAMPIGLLLCAGPDADEWLLRLGLSVERELNGVA